MKYTYFHNINISIEVSYDTKINHLTMKWLISARWIDGVCYAQLLFMGFFWSENYFLYLPVFRNMWIMLLMYLFLNVYYFSQHQRWKSLELWFNIPFGIYEAILDMMGVLNLCIYEKFGRGGGSSIYLLRWNNFYKWIYVYFEYFVFFNIL